MLTEEQRKAIEAAATEIEYMHADLMGRGGFSSDGNANPCAQALRELLAAHNAGAQGEAVAMPGWPWGRKEPTTKMLREMAYELNLVPRGEVVCVQFLDILRSQYKAAFKAAQSDPTRTMPECTGAQEPYAYIYEFDMPSGVHRELEYCSYNCAYPSRTVAVYAHPQPMTQAQPVYDKSVVRRLATQWGMIPETDSERDARRYQWLRAQHEMQTEFEDAEGFVVREAVASAWTVFRPGRTTSLEPVGCIPGELDKAIDAALQAEKEKR